MHVYKSTSAATAAAFPNGVGTFREGSNMLTSFHINGNLRQAFAAWLMPCFCNQPTIALRGKCTTSTTRKERIGFHPKHRYSAVVERSITELLKSRLVVYGDALVFEFLPMFAVKPADLKLVSLSTALKE